MHCLMQAILVGGNSNSMSISEAFPKIQKTRFIKAGLSLLISVSSEVMSSVSILNVQIGFDASKKVSRRVNYFNGRAN